MDYFILCFWIKFCVSDYFLFCAKELLIYNMYCTLGNHLEPALKYVKMSSQHSAQKSAVQSISTGMTQLSVIKPCLPIFTEQLDSLEPFLLSLRLSLIYGWSNAKFRDHPVLAFSDSRYKKKPSLNTIPASTCSYDHMEAKVQSQSHGNHLSHQSKCFNCQQSCHHADCPVQQLNISY